MVDRPPLAGTDATVPISLALLLQVLRATLPTLFGDGPAVDPDPALGAVAGVPGVLLLGRDTHRPWIEKWLLVRRCRDELAAAYSCNGPMLGNVEVERRVEMFFVECDHTRDWITEAGVTAAAVSTLLTGS